MNIGKQAFWSQHMVRGVNAGMLFRWGIVFFLLLVCIRHYSSTGRWRKKEEREHTCIDLICGEAGVKCIILWQTQNTWPLQEWNASGNINFTCCLPTVGERDHLSFPKMLNISVKLTDTSICLELPHVIAAWINILQCDGAKNIQVLNMHTQIGSMK